jgi:regulatory protein
VKSRIEPQSRQPAAKDLTRSAYTAALDVLARRDRSLAELSQSLSRKGFQETEVAQALQRVVELGYLNEERLAESIVRDSRLAGRGPRAAWLKLRRRGIGGWSLERVQQQWRGESVEASELAVASEYVKMRYPGFSGDPIEDRKVSRRAMGALVRRGYSFEVAQAAVREAMAAGGFADDPEEKDG